MRRIELDSGEIEFLYTRCGFTKREIAQRLGVSFSTIKRAFQRFGILTNPHYRRRPKKSRRISEVASKRMKERWELERDRMLEVARQASTFYKGRAPWNKDLSKEVSAKVKLAALKRSIRMGPVYISEEYRQKRSEAAKGRNNPNWRGDISCLPYDPCFNNDLKRKIKERDGYRCQVCGVTEEESLARGHGYLVVHHLDGNKQNSDPQNLITLCNSCHTRWHRSHSREQITAFRS